LVVEAASPSWRAAAVLCGFPARPHVAGNSLGGRLSAQRDLLLPVPANEGLASLAVNTPSTSDAIVRNVCGRLL